MLFIKQDLLLGIVFFKSSLCICIKLSYYFLASPVFSLHPYWRNINIYTYTRNPNIHFHNYSNYIIQKYEYLQSFIITGRRNILITHFNHLRLR